ncbi:MAG TPA: 3-phosphoserine/phosphohydroxythreonine transaminase [Bacteroidetes bacterium]|nr:3-phosphoserine/phosphohydroxythreonine transaminase [Bacteroidota bacterium]
MKKHNFSAGPAILPQSVLKEASQAVKNFNGIGLSILEISHRSPEFDAVIKEAESLVREIAGIDDSYAVLFLTGGASSQFYMTPMNLLGEDETAAYIDTGTWSSKAIKEAKNFGDIDIIASSKDRNYSYIPKRFKKPQDAAYLHITSNNTISGTQFHKFPDVGAPLICDMSSDIFSRPIDVSKFGMIYAGAQKNLGPSGVTLVILKKELVGRSGRVLPTMLNYQTHIDKGSMFNTPPTYPIYVLMLTLRWIKGKGGLEAIEKMNKSKARLLYKEIDSNPCFTGTVDKKDRSLMNVCFLPTKDEYAAPFLDMCTKAGISGVKGHRSVGGFRASIYNAMPRRSVKVLVDLMQEFAAKHG